MDPPLLCGPGMDPDRGCQAGHGAGPDSGTPGGVRLQCRGHAPLRDLGLSVAVHDHTGDRCGGVLRVCRDLRYPHGGRGPISGDIAGRAATAECPNAMRSGIGSADDGQRCRRPTGRSPARWVKGLERGRYMIGSTTWTHGMTPRSRLFAIGGSVPERLMALAGVPPVGRSCRRRVPHRSLFGPRPRECR